MFPNDTTNIDTLNTTRVGTGELQQVAIDSNAQAIAIQELVAKVGTTGDSRTTTLDKRVAVLEVSGGGGGGGAVSSVDGNTGAVVLSGTYEAKNTNIQTHIASTSNPHAVTKTQIGLSNVPNTDATARANHTGTQSADTLTDGTTNKAFLATERTKLSGIATSATANDTDTNLKARANHTGTQTASTISDFSTASDARISAAAGVSIASLSGGKIPTSQIPALGLVTVQTAASQAAQLALTTQEGDVVVRTDTSVTYMRNAGVSGTMTDFTLLSTPTAPVASVNSQTGTVVLGKTDVGLGNVDNTADTAKPVSTAQQTALDLKANLASPTFTGTVSGITKTMVGLSNVPNTDATARANHTGTQLASTISDFSTSVDSRITAQKGGSPGLATTDGTGKLSMTQIPATVPTLTGSETLTNKTLTSSTNTFATVTTTTSSATPTPTGDSRENELYVTALAVGATIAAPTGTPTNGNKLVIRVKDNATAQTLAFNAIFRAIGVTLPTTTVISKTLYIGAKYNSSDSKWDVIALSQEA